jgi:RNA polymerase sigma-70 factor (sigma-E family)
VRASKAERDAAFATFMDQTGPALLRTAWFLTGDTDRAQELTQAAFVKTYVVWHRIDQDRALAYARRCLVNHKIDVWRATRHQVVADLTSVGFELGSTSQSQLQSQSRDGAVATADHRDDLVRRLSRLPEQQRKVVVLRYYADQSEASVAEALGISVGSVKSAASRGLAALRQQAEAGPKPRSRPLPAWTHSPNATPFTEGSLR